MTNEELIQKFYEIVSPNGKNISSRHQPSYWKKNGYEKLYNLILERTSFLDSSVVTHLKERISALEKKLTHHPSCVSCGNPVMIIGRNTFSDYCSKGCVYKDPNISQKRKISSQKVDKKTSNDKRKSTMISKYGVEYNSQRDDIKKILSQSKIKYTNQYALDKLDSYEWMFENYVTKQRTLVDIGRELGVYYGTVGGYCMKHGFEIRQRTNYSLQEKEIGKFINSLGYTYTTDRKTLNGYEIDILVNGKDVGIEVDGVYWHSYNRFESSDEKRRHLTKTISALNKGVRLIHIFDTEWIHKNEIVKSIIRNKLGDSKRIYARKCEIREIDTTTSSEFLNKNHIQGTTGSSVRIGLFHENELVMVMTFGKPRFNRKYEWELIRMSTITNTSVVGGASKLFNYFINTNTISNGILCYSDRRFGEGDVYESLGFGHINSTEPGYYWTNGEFVWYRTKFQKRKLNTLLKEYKEELSEAENMFNNGYRRLWDCGSNVFVYEKSHKT